MCAKYPKMRVLSASATCNYGIGEFVILEQREYQVDFPIHIAHFVVACCTGSQVCSISLLGGSEIAQFARNTVL